MTDSAFSSNLPQLPCDCDKDPIAGIKRLFVDYAQGRTILAGREPATRPVFLRFHGAVSGSFHIEPDLPNELRVGLFSDSKKFAVWVRFSSDVQPGRPERRGTVGVAIKLFDVPGEKLLEQHASTHDLILQNHDVFFVDGAKDMCEFTCFSLNGKGQEYEDAHPKTARILQDMQKEVRSVLSQTFWSVLPYKLGERAVKYKLEPTESTFCDEPDFSDPTYLRADLHTRMKRGDTRFRFLVQVQTVDDEMPIDAATVRWSEELSPPIHVATLVLPAQDPGARGQSSYGENLAFNPWNSLPDHAPLGSIAEARRVAYEASAYNRRNVNGVSVGEPSAPRPTTFAEGVPYPNSGQREIVSAKIHPAIGIARVGDSESGFYIGPEVIDPPSEQAGFYRDDTGALKRQAARFRVYGHDAAGKVVRELTSDVAKIEWCVHVANKKASFFEWELAMDIPEAKDLELSLRNQKVEARQSLEIDPGAHSISGKSAEPVLCIGNFRGVPVKLGELRTDEAGRLVFLGGHGKSASPSGAPIFEKGRKNPFINAEDWYDDVCDGPVLARVSIEGREIPVDSAWVATAPPNYAPQLKGQRTMYDLMYDLFLRAGWLPDAGEPTFAADILPILKRLSDMQWVNQGFATRFGYRAPFDFSDPAYLRRLSAKPKSAHDHDENQEERRQIFNSFRPPEPSDGNQLPWPWLYGDAMEVPAEDNPRQNAAITQTQFDTLQRWVDGAFVDDWDRPRPAPSTIGEVRLEDQPSTLDRAALEFCLADAFHPGCEMTWPMRHLTMYRAPFRLKLGKSQERKGLPRKADQQWMLSRGGPLFEQGPGDLTRWMGLPWQADTAFCRAGYDQKYDPFAPTFWPARVPNQVLSEANYELVVSSGLPLEKRIDAFKHRTNWNAPLKGDTAQQMEQMVHIFGAMGLIETRSWKSDIPEIPDSLMVASYGPEVAEADQRTEAMPPHETKAIAKEKVLGRAHPASNFASVEEGLAAPLPLRRKKSEY